MFCCCLTFETNLSNLVQIRLIQLDQIGSNQIKQVESNQVKLVQISSYCQNLGVGAWPPPLFFVFDYWKTWLMLVMLEHVQAFFYWFNLFLKAEILTKISLVFWSIRRHQRKIAKLNDLYRLQLKHWRKYLDRYLAVRCSLQCLDKLLIFDKLN